MANTLTSPTRHVDRLIRYVLTEKKDQAKGERWVAASAGNGFVVDASASVRIATDVMRRHRKLVGFVQGYHVIDSYAVDELDPSDPEDFERAQQAGRRRAKRLAKGRPYLVVTQVDGKGSEEHPGGKLHNHIVILSTHPVTGRAFDSSWVTHKTLAAEHDEVLAEVGITQTLPPALAHRANVLSKAEYELPGRIQMWESKRDMALEAGEAFTEPMPVVWIADMKVGIAGVMAHRGYTSREEAIEVARAEFSLDLRLRGREDDLPGISWSVLDEHGNTTKMTRRSSTLGTDFGCAALDAAIERNIALVREQQAAQPALSALQTEWLERIGQSYDTVFDARMAMTRAGVDVADQNAVMDAWEAEQARVSGYPVVDQGGQPQTPEIDQVGESIDSPTRSELRPEPTSGQQVGREIPDVGSEADQIASEGPEIVENGPNPTSSGRSTTALATGGHSAPTRGREADSKRSQGGSAIDEQPDLELLELRYLAATEGASWTDEQYDAALARMDALKAQLGIPDDEVPSRDEVIAEYERRVLGAEPSSALASSGTPSAPPGLDSVNEEGPLPEGTDPDLAPAASGPSPAAPALVDQPAAEPPAPPGLVDAGSPVPPGVGEPAEPYRSAVRELADETDDPKAKAVFESIARFDEQSREVLMAGGRIPNNDVVKVSKGTGDKWQRAQTRLDPVVRHEMTLRAERMAERRADFDEGKALKERLDRLAERGDFVTDEYRDTDQRLGTSNAQRRLIEERMNAGIYEEGSKWRPGQPIPDRVQSQSMRARLHQIAEQALDEQAAVATAPDSELGG